MTANTANEVRAHVRKGYGEVAVKGTGCCGPAPSGTGSACCAPASQNNSPSTSLGYDAEDLGTIPAGSDLGLGCGNPIALAELKPGETVLDLGSGAGIDCFLAARAVGPRGKVIGVDMTPEMIAKARRNAIDTGVENVDFRHGEIEHLPVADNSIDVIVSNCVINLSPQKDAVMREAYRALKPGGRLRVSDVVATTAIPESLSDDLASISGCVGNSASVAELKRMMLDAGFTEIDVAVNEASREGISNWLPGSDAGSYVASASITASKPRS